MKINEETRSRISTLIEGRLENSVTSLEVVNWLGNFESSEIDMALDILEKLEFFSVPRMVSTYNGNLHRIFTHFKEKNVIFLAIGEFAKSGTAMSYFIKQAPSFNDGRFKKRKYLANSAADIPRIVEKESIDAQNFLLVLVDDFVGSGKSTVGYYHGDEDTLGLKTYLEQNQLHPSLAILSLIVLEEGLAHIRSEMRTVYVAAEKRSKIFSKRGSVFGYRPTMLPIREMAYARGSKLVKNPSWSLGYDNSQGLVAFAHTTPNNTLPIMWSSNDGWQPLYPRFGPDKVLRFKQFREQSRYWLSLASEHARSAFPETGSAVYSTLNLQIISILRLKSAKRAVPVICQLMGIAMFEYEQIIEEGKLRGLFDRNGNVSALGLDMFDQLKKKALIQKNRQRRLLKGDDEIIYLPLTFGGET